MRVRRATDGFLFYCRLAEPSHEFTEPTRVNSQLNSAVATGTIRGAHLAVGKAGRVHVAWNGSGKATPKGAANPDLPEDSPYRLSSPMLYSRINATRDKFEPQRNLRRVRSGTTKRLPHGKRKDKSSLHA